jgi:hypothetical protein
MHRRVRIRHLFAGAIALVALIFTTGVPAGATGPTVLLDGLSSSKGLTLDGNGNPVVSQGALGPPGPTLRYNVSTGQVEQLTGGPQSTVGIAWAKTGNSFWTLGTYYRALLRPDIKQAPTVIGKLATFADQNPDPHNTNGPKNESNPFAIAALPNGDAVIGDAAANSVVKVTKSGQMSLVARLAPEDVKTDHLPPEERPPVDKIAAEAVADSIAVAADGSIYIGELKGFPFRPGSSRIWKIAPGVTGATCSANPRVPNVKCTLVASGLTSIGALAVSPDGSTIYAFEYAAGGVGEFEAGCFGPGGCPPAVLLQIKGGQRKELAAGQLSQPGALALRGNTLYITDHVVTDGRLLKLTV